MSSSPGLRVVATWRGAEIRNGATVVDTEAFDAEARPERMRLRREGHLTPEETALLTRHASEPLSTRDRRLAGGSVELRARGPREGGVPRPDDWRELRELLLESGREALRSSWDPSIHVEEAVRAAADLDRVANLLGERIASWTGRDGPGAEDGGEDASGEPLAREIAEGRWQPAADLPGADPALLEARRNLARLLLETRTTHRALTQAVAAALPRRAPNVAALLGPDLGARMISQAGGLDRLARLPASTIQVLGAERAFFEHLRGRAPPPRHGLLFLHPQVQSAPRAIRGRIARALAGKVAIAARLDLAGAPVRAELRSAFEARAKAVRSQGSATKGRPQPR